MTQKKNTVAVGRMQIIATALLWGLAGVCVKSIPWNSFTIMASRCAIGIPMLGIAGKSFSLKCSKTTLLGSVMMSITGILYMASIKLTTAATAIVLQYTAPLFVFLFSVFVQKRKPKLYEILIILTAFGGCVLSFAGDLDPTKLLGNLLGLLSGISFAGQIIVFGGKNADADKGMFLSNVISFVCCLPFVFFDKALCFSPKILFWVLVLGIFQYGLANINYAKGCKKIDKMETSLLLMLEPIFNPIPVWILTGEKMTPLALTGFFVVILALIAYAAVPAVKSKKEGNPHPSI